jgi:type I restriction enzyme S subunit
VSDANDLQGTWPSDDIPNSWTWTNLEEVLVNVTSSEKKLPASQYAPSGAYAVVDQGAGSIGGFTDDSSLIYSGSLPVVIFGDHTRVIKLIEKPFVQGADGVKVLLPRPSVDGRFAYWALQTLRLPDKGYARHFKYLCASRFPVAPLPEQRRIVEKLEYLLARSRRAKEALDAIPPLLEKLRQSVLAAAFRGDLTADWRAKNPNVEPAEALLARIRVERRKAWEAAELAKMKAKGKAPGDDRWKEKYVEPEPVDASELPELPEGWCWASLAELADFINGDRGKDYPNQKEYVTHGLPFINAGHIQPNGTLSLNSMNYITREKFNTLGSGKIRHGDLLYCLRGTLGKTAYVDPLTEGAIASSLVIIRPCDSDLTRLIYFFLTSPLGNEEISKYDNGSAQPNLSVQSLAQYILPIPPKQEVEVLCKQIDAALATTQSTANAIELLRAATISLDRATLAKAFRGELVPQDPNDEPASVMLARLRQAPSPEALARGPSRGRKRAAT